MITYYFNIFANELTKIFNILGENNGFYIKVFVSSLFILNILQLFYWLINIKPHSREQLKYLVPESLFTSLGILGTFVGITLALSANPKTDPAAVSKIMAGMSTAFDTSIWGLVFSLILGSIRNIANKNIKNQTYYLKKISENSSQDMAESARLLSDGVKDLVTAMKIMSANVDPEVTANKIASAVTSSMNPFFKSLESKMSVIDGLADATIEIKEVNKQLASFIQKDLRSIFDALRDSVESSNQSIKETNSSLQLTKTSLEQQRDNLQEVETTLKSFAQEMKVVLEKQVRDFSEVSRTSVNLLESTGKSLNELINNSLKNVDVIIEKTATATLHSLEKFRDEYNERLQHYLETQGQHLDKHLRANAEKLSTTVGEMSEVLGKFVENNETIMTKQDKSIKLLFEIVTKSEATKEYHSFILSDANKSLMDANKHIDKNVTHLAMNYQATSASLEKISQTTKIFEEDFEKNVIKTLETYQFKVDNHIASILNNIYQTTSIIQSQAEALQIKQKERV